MAPPPRGIPRAVWRIAAPRPPPGRRWQTRWKLCSRRRCAKTCSSSRPCADSSRRMGRLRGLRSTRRRRRMTWRSSHFEEPRKVRACTRRSATRTAHASKPPLLVPVRTCPTCVGARVCCERNSYPKDRGFGPARMAENKTHVVTMVGLRRTALCTCANVSSNHTRHTKVRTRTQDPRPKTHEVWRAPRGPRDRTGGVCGASNFGRKPGSMNTIAQQGT